MEEDKNTEVEKEVSAEDLEYMNGTPTRIEVANYVNGLLENHYFGLVREVSNGSHLGLMVLQAILITKGIITEDELKSVTEEFVKRAKSAEDSDTEDN